MRRTLALALIASACALTACGGSDGTTSAGTDRAGLVSCLKELGIEGPAVSNEPSAEEKAAGMTELINGVDLEEQQWGYGVYVFESAERAAAYVATQQAEADAPDAPGFVKSRKYTAHGVVAVDSETDAPKRAEVEACAGGSPG